MVPAADSPAAYFDSNARGFHGHYDSDPDFRERLALWSALLERFGRKGARMLDAGCGPGLFSLHGATLGMTVVGIDPAPSMLSLAEAERVRRRIDNVTFERAGIDDLGARDLRMDLIISSSVLEYVEDLDRSLRTLASCLAENGTLIVSMPNAACTYRKVETALYRATGRPRYRGYIRHLMRPQELAARGASVGLRVVEQQLFATQHRLRMLNPLLRQHQRAAMFAMVFSRTGA